MPVLDHSPRLAALYTKAVLATFTKSGGSLPDRTYERFRVGVDAAHLAAYNRVCGFRLGDELPATYLHVLTFPMQVKLMTDTDFPFPLIGSIHVANRIVQRRPVLVGEVLDLRVGVADLRNHPRGVQFDVISSVAVGGVEVWSGVSTYLRRTSAGSGSASGREELPGVVACWDVPGDVGRRYAGVSGDRNPIHLHALTARVFGYSRPIAHGMWTKARCLAALEGRLPGAFEVDVRFKLPVHLPARVGFCLDGRRFAVAGADGGKPHLTGTVVDLSA
ncbi:MaoC family dehydratase [Actinokineospora globicatena]|uniref:MaoC-like domain-containing protein n=1 Tax=Actinokineospora globicatena TaxID=103729 RepID=A0A9W6QPF8_9PSEU|nr:MaoC/PaaZ C-terminal domain-containing protein [Actinokineospora globicatena]GLW92203.1 hypothetical protein Aglo03_30190 [Actinokineospora globicatena]